MENPELNPASKGIETGPSFHAWPELLVEIVIIQNGCGLYAPSPKPAEAGVGDLEPAYTKIDLRES